VLQGLEIARAHALYQENVDSFYDNLVTLYSTHNYPPDRIWNCDKTGAQAGREGGGIVIAKRGSRFVHSIIPGQREWLSCLVCVNAPRVSIPSFYVFRGTRFRRNYIERCKAGATMAMQVQAWMISYLLSTWISHFIESVTRIGGISPTRRHLLILDGHSSHVIVDVMREAKSVGLDLLTLPSYTFHALQPLDVAVFKPFKSHFREYCNHWLSRNMNQRATKEILAQWMSLALKKALIDRNIKKDFSTTRIYPINRGAIREKLTPSQSFTQAQSGFQSISTCELHAGDAAYGSGGADIAKPAFDEGIEN
jgi:hypothetical protein